jgi:hypothetical protein
MVAPKGAGWQSFEQVAPGVFYAKIRSQAFDFTGQPAQSEQLLSTVETNLQTEAHANVAALTSGGYVVVWESWKSADPTDTSYSILR